MTPSRPHLRLRPAPALAALLAAASAACAPDPLPAPPSLYEPPPLGSLPPLPALAEDPGPMRRVARLLDALPGAEVSSPALGRPAATRPWEDVVPGKLLARPRNWLALGDLPPSRDGGALRVADNAFLALPAIPLARYRLSGRVHPGAGVSDALGDEVSAVPLVWELDSPWDAAAGGADHFARTFLELRRPRIGPPDEGGFRSFVAEWTALKASRQLVLGLVADAELREQRGFWPRGRPQGSAEGRPSFADLKLEVVAGSEGADPSEIKEIGGSVPSVDHPLAARIGIGRDERDSLLLPSPGRATFEMDIPQGAVLDVATGVARSLSPDPFARVTFRVVLEAADRPRTTALEVRPDPAADGARWTPHRIDLSAWGGARVRLSLETEGQGGLAWAAFASPEIWAPAPPEAGAPPVFLLVSVDTLRADRLSAYGYPHPTSPALDRLAEDGTLFLEHVTAANWTLPTHASMLTGLSPSGHRAGTWSASVHEQVHAAIPDGLPTLADPFRDAGFRTAAVVSAPFLFPAFGYGRGFDSYDSSAVHSAHHVAAHEDVTAADVAARTLRALEEGRHRPLFLFVHHWDVHFEFLPPEKALRAARPDFTGPMPDYQELYRGKGPLSEALDRAEEAVRKRRGVTAWQAARDAFTADDRAWADRELLSALYDGEVRSVDDALSQVFDLLRRQGRYDAATIAVTGDHGEELHERGRLGHGGPLLYPEVHGSPLILKPAGGGRGLRISGATTTIDVAPTLLDLAGLPRPREFQGRSLAAAVRGGAPPPGAVLCEDGAHTGLMVRDGEWGLVAVGSTQELYNRQDDPAFSRDLAPAYPDKVASLRRAAADLLVRDAWGGVVVLTGAGSPGIRWEIEATGLPEEARVWGWSSGDGRPLRFGRGRERLGVTLAAGEAAVVVFEAGLPAPSSLRISADGSDLPVGEWLVPQHDEARSRAHGTAQAFQRGPRGDNRPAETAGATRDQLRALGYVQ
ncbi:sulfatase [Myxococcota bacterium]|nr:sulfatase [Myxococcota bacterium]